MKTVIACFLVAFAAAGVGAGLMTLVADPKPATVAGICYDPQSGADRAYILNGAVTCMSGTFIPVDPAPYHE